MLKLIFFGTLKQFFLTFNFQEKQRPETCTVEFIESKQVFVATAFFSLLASVIIVLFQSYQFSAKYTKKKVFNQLYSYLDHFELIRPSQIGLKKMFQRQMQF